MFKLQADHVYSKYRVHQKIACLGACLAFPNQGFCAHSVRVRIRYLNCVECKRYFITCFSVYL